MKQQTAKLLKGLSTILVIFAVIIAFLISGMRIFGFQVYGVLTGSMEPAYPTGSLIYVKAVDYKQLKVGDPITYMISQNTVVTHRIIEVLIDEEDPDTIRYFTKGDANEVADGSSVHYKNIIGKPVFSIPLLGYVSNYIQNPPGMYVAIALGVLLIILVFLPDFMGKKKKEPEAEAAPSVEAPAAAPAETPAAAPAETPAAPVEAAEPTVPEEPKASIVITDQNASENGADDNTNA